MPSKASKAGVTVLHANGGPWDTPPTPPSPPPNSTFMSHGSDVHHLTSPPRHCQEGGLGLLPPWYKWGN